MSETKIASFIVRFVQGAGKDAGDRGEAPAGRLVAPWRGVIRHVQSREEMRFTAVDEAVAFMERYVALRGPLAQEAGAPGRFVSANGLRLHFLEYPAAGGEAQENLVFLPGLTANAHMVDGLIAASLGEQYRVLAPDWRGRGRSAKPDTGYSIGDHAADVLALLDLLAIDRVVLAGHSFGGLVAYYMAACYPHRVKKLIVLDSSVLLISERTRNIVQSSLDRLGRRVASMERYLQAMREAPFLQGMWNEALERYYRSDVKSHDDGSVQALARPEAIAETIDMEFVEPWNEHIAAIRQPVLLLNALEPYGPEGAPPILPEEMARETAAALADCRYVTVPGNHVTMLFGDNAREVVRVIGEFLAE